MVEGEDGGWRLQAATEAGKGERCRSGAEGALLQATPAAAPWEAVDWSAPWLGPWRARGEVLAQRWGGEAARGGELGALARSLQACAASPRAVPQSALPRGEAYERFIFETGQLPTRDNLHDFFNALVWQQFACTKQRMNGLQAQAIAADGVQAVRGALRDAITVFDENGALLYAPDALWQALVERDWARLFGALRPLWAQSQLVLFGHALMEKLVSPRKPMVAHVFRSQVAIDSVATADAWLAQALQPEAWARKPFVPLPVLGVPGWWAANAQPGFYEDAQVFRPPRVPRGA